MGQEERKDMLDKELKQQRQIVELKKQEESKIMREIDDLRRTNSEEELKKKELHEENLELQKEMKQKHEEIKNWTSEKDKTQKAFDQLKRRKALADEQRHEIEISRGVLKADTENLIREIELLRKQVELDGKTVTDIMRERETLNRSVIRTDDRTKKQSEIVKLHESRTTNLE